MKLNELMPILRVAARQSLAVSLAFMMVPFAQMQLNAQDAYAPLGAEQLDQLVAPIALYPDSLVAQVLAAATYPQQVTDANNYVHQNAGLPPDQLAAAVNGQPWDPSVKALTAFPSVLDNLARNIGWTSALGNAYYNQPADIMNAVQAMRYQAQEAGNLRSTSQLRVYDDAGQILIAPVNPAYVYVPYYNPWVVYGAPLPAYSGYYWAPPSHGLVYAGLIGFAAVAIGVGVWAHYNWGWHAWSPNWRGGNVFYNRNAYISRSTTVYNRGNFGAFNRGVYEHGGAGVPHNFHPAVRAEEFRGGVPAGRPEFNRAPAAAARPAEGRFERSNPNVNRPGAEAARPAQGRPAVPTQARPEYRAPAAQARPQAVARPQVHAPEQHAQPTREAHPQAARPAAAEHHAAPAQHKEAEHKEKK